MNKITLVFPYYKNPKMLEYQMSIWRKYPLSVINNLEIIVVDDGSPVGFRAEEVFRSSIEKFGNFDFKIRKFRILVDLPWNECGAKNLGIVSASSGWILVTDVDHIVTSELLAEAQSKDLKAGVIYKFKRIHHISKDINKPHAESILAEVETLYSKTGMYDESFCGHYSFCVRDFLTRNKYLEAEKVELDTPLERVDYNMIFDAKTHGLVRKDGCDDAAYEEIKAWKAANNIGVQALRLPWKEVVCG